VERDRTRSIQSFIVDTVEGDPKGIARRVAQAYGISRQAANRHLDALVEAGVLDQAGMTRARAYALRRTAAVSREFRVTPVLDAGRVWGEHAFPVLAGDRAVVRETCRATFHALLENALAHARASWIRMDLVTSAREIDLSLADDGCGVFTSLAERLQLGSPREAAEELARRGRLRSTERSTARLLLVARALDQFVLASSGIQCEFAAEDDRWEVRANGENREGTTVTCRLRRSPQRRA
jgi:hypothetical protein